MDKIGEKLDITVTEIRLKKGFPIRVFETNELVLEIDAKSCKAIECSFKKY